MAVISRRRRGVDYWPGFVDALASLALAAGNEIGESYTGYTLTTDRNGGSATVRGLEFSYSQHIHNHRR